MPRATTRASVWLIRAVDLGYGALLLLVPLLMGGRHPWGRLVLVATVAMMAVAWTARQALLARGAWRRSPAEWWLLAAVALLVFELLPLPQALLRGISPHLFTVLPLWTSGEATIGRLGTWNCLSLAPGATAESLVLLTAYGALFLITVQRLERIEHVAMLLRAIALSALAMAALGVVQYLASNGKFLWVYAHPFRDTSQYVMGTFINRNHFAHFLALGIGPLVWMLVDARRRAGSSAARPFPRPPGSLTVASSPAVIAGALAAVLLAGLWSLSRGGTIAMLVALVVSSLILRRNDLIRRDTVAVLIGAALLLAVSLLVAGDHRMADRLGQLTSGSIDTIDPGAGRRTLWRANLAAFRDFPLTGTGAGSHRWVCPKYLPKSYRIEYTHADNGYVQVASETGIAGIGLMALAIGYCARWCIDGARRSVSAHHAGCLAAVAAGLSSSAVHSLVDFVWYVPACMTLTVLLAACAYLLWRASLASDAAAAAAGGGTPKRGIPERGIPEPRKEVATHPGRAGVFPDTIPAIGLGRPVWIALCAVVLLTGTCAVGRLAGAALASRDWDAYRRGTFAVARLSDELDRIEPADRSGRAAPAAEIERLAASGVRHLRAALRRDPRHARAHLCLAVAYLDRFDRLQRASENAIDVSQIREAALASRFASSKALDDWLTRVLGPRRQLLQRALWHTRRALALAPLDGRAYLMLADLSFLEAAGGADEPARAGVPAEPRGMAGRMAGRMVERKRAYIDQALRVRPHDGDVLYQAGREAVLVGDYARAVAYWKESFAQGGRYQQRIIDRMAGQVPASFFLEMMQPDFEALRRLAACYRRIGHVSAYRAAVGELARGAAARAARDRGEAASRWWIEAADHYGALGDHASQTQCLRRAVALAPYDEALRRRLGLRLLEVGHFADAETHLRWCVRLGDADRRLQRALREAVARQVASNRPAAALERHRPVTAGGP